MKIAYTILVLVVAVLAVIFAAQNNTQVQINFFSWSSTGLLSIILAITLVVGVLLGILVMLSSTLKQGRVSSGLKKKVSALEKEKGEIFNRLNANGSAGTSGNASAAPTAGRAEGVEPAASASKEDTKKAQ
ncbi:MAG: LapA family protein [Spirochaetaceae bacterium]|nr:LapA family protein [Spirochaetaceae bacterium]